MKSTHSTLGRVTVSQADWDSVAGVILIDATDENDVIFNTKLNRWITVRKLDGAMGEGARSAARLAKQIRRPIGDLPLVVIGAGKRAQPPGISTEQWLEMRNSRDRRVKDLSKLSRNSKFILDPTSGHNIERDNPQLVADVIHQLVREIAVSRKPVKF